MADGPLDPSEEIRKKVDARLDELERQLNAEGLDDEELAELERLTRGYVEAENDNPAVRVMDEGIGKLETMAESIKADVPEPFEDPAFQARFERLHDRAESVRKARESQVAEQAKQRKSEAEAARGLGVGLSIAYTMIGLPLIGYGIGYLIDQRMGTETAKGFWGFGGVVLGFIMVFVLHKRTQSSEGP